MPYDHTTESDPVEHSGTGSAVAVAAVMVGAFCLLVLLSVFLPLFMGDF